MKRLLFLVLSITFIGGPARAENSAAYWSLARQILAGIDRAPMAAVPAGNGYGAPRIAVSTVASDGNATSEGDEITRRLLHSLRENAGGRYRFVATDALEKIIGSIKKDGSPADDARARIRDLRVNARPDVLVLGAYRHADGETQLNYQALNPETGELLASSEARWTDRPTPPPKPVTMTKSVQGTSIYRPRVEEAERLLDDKGYNPGPVDGYMTEETRQALKTYQMDSALPPNGRLTRRTVINLRRDTRGLDL